MSERTHRAPHSAPGETVHGAVRDAVHDSVNGPDVALRERTILLATDGSYPAAAAAKVAAALARERGARPQVVNAYDTTGLPIPAPLPALLSAADAVIGADVHTPAVRALQADLAATIGRVADWPVHIGLGTPAGVVARVAAEIGAAVIVMGLRRHSALDRVLHDETTLNVMRGASCPVLGVTPSLHTLPRCIVVGTDFGPAALQAARFALAMLADDGTLVLAHAEVPDRDRTEDEPAGSEIVYTSGLDAAFARLETDLAVPAGVQVRRARPAVGSGRRVADELLGIAARHGADLVAVGSRRYDWLDRALLGSVSSELVRDGRVSVLVVPPAPTRPRNVFNT